jgi:hypothetical protein
VNNIASIPTLYEGVQYRSRLEAKWAAFFDLLGWTHQYEPFDLDGWIPDFLLPGRCPVLVEVKPITTRDGTICAEMLEAAEGFRGDLMLVGCVVPVVEPNLVEGTAIGWLHETPGTTVGAGCGWGLAVLGDFRGIGGRFGLCHDIGSYADRITGLHDGDHCFHESMEKKARRAWALAGNLVQWKAA